MLATAWISFPGIRVAGAEVPEGSNVLGLTQEDGRIVRLDDEVVVTDGTLVVELVNKTDEPMHFAHALPCHRIHVRIVGINDAGKIAGSSSDDEWTLGAGQIFRQVVDWRYVSTPTSGPVLDDRLLGLEPGTYEAVVVLDQPEWVVSRTVQLRYTGPAADHGDLAGVARCAQLNPETYESLASELWYSIENGVLRARLEGWLLWQYVLHPHPEHYARQQFFGPVLAGDLVYACAGNALYEMRPLDGRVLRRLLLPGRCVELVSRDGQVAVTARGGEYSCLMGWCSADTRWQETTRIEPGEGTVPFFLVHPFYFAGWPRRQARILEDRLPEDVDDGPWPPDEIRPLLEEVASELGALARMDPTNPWYHFERGEILEDLGREREAREAYEAVLEHHGPAHDFDLLRMAWSLDRKDPELADRAFERAMTFLLGSGYEPELSTALMSMAFYVTFPSNEPFDLDDDEDWVAASRLGDRLHDFAPECEGIAYFHRRMREQARLRGDVEAAATWHERYERSEHHALITTPTPPTASGLALNLFFAVMIAFLALALIKVARTLSSGFEGERPPWWIRFNPLARITRAELAGLVLVFPLMLLANVVTSLEVAVMGTVASSSDAVLDGSLGHPEARAYLRGTTGGQALGFMKALGLQQSGKLDEAAGIYAAIDRYPEAGVNLAVIRSAQGDDEEARRLWEQALSEDPDLAEAAYNLGREARSSRVDRARRYGLEEPLLAMPPPALIRRAWRDLALERASLSYLDGLDVVRWMGFTGNGERSIGWKLPVHLANLIVFVLAVIALVTLRSRHRTLAPRHGTVGWALGLLVPGAARQYGFLGPLVAVAFAFLAVGGFMLIVSGGQSPSFWVWYGLPVFARYFNLRATGAQLLDFPWWYAFFTWWWVGIVLNLVVVAVMEAVRPDPAGLVSRMRSSR